MHIIAQDLLQLIQHDRDGNGVDRIQLKAAIEVLIQCNTTWTWQTQRGKEGTSQVSTELYEQLTRLAAPDACAEEQQRASDYLQGEPSACPAEVSPAPLLDISLQEQYQVFVRELSLARESQIELYTMLDVQEMIASLTRNGRQDLLVPDVVSSLLRYILWLCSSGNSSDTDVAGSCLAELAVIAPPQVLPALDQVISFGQQAEKVAALTCLEHCICRKRFSAESLNVPKLIVMVGTALSTNQETADSILCHKVRLAAIRLAKGLLYWPIYFHSSDDAVLGELLGLVSKECTFTKTTTELVGKNRYTLDLALENRVAAFHFLEVVLDLLEDKLNVEEIMSAATLACHDEAWKKGQRIDSRCCALQVVKKVVSKHPELLADHVGNNPRPFKGEATLIAGLYRAFFDLRLVRAETPEDEGALWTFIVGLRQIFADFKEVEPTHPVFAALEEMLDARRAMWAKAKDPTTRQTLTAYVDKYRNPESEGLGADAE